jgi:hypothetical protein
VGIPTRTAKEDRNNGRMEQGKTGIMEEQARTGT